MRALLHGAGGMGTSKDSSAAGPSCDFVSPLRKTLLAHRERMDLPLTFTEVQAPSSLENDHVIGLLA